MNLDELLWEEKRLKYRISFAQIKLFDILEDIKLKHDYCEKEKD